MDDYNISAISEAKNEYSARLVNILTPLLIEGIKSIFKEALELCISNSEKDKYLMTFQNFLTRVPKWNQSIILQETSRIVTKSGCNYLEDLVTCVHISQLKILTSIRVASKQKKVDIEIPKLSEFIHYCYIAFARKLYSNVYLFETKISSLQMQKNHRECELVCKECILNVIRNNIPVDKILRAYIDETTEEEVIEEQKIEEKPVEKNNIEASFDEVIKNDEPLKNNETVVEVKKTVTKAVEEQPAAERAALAPAVAPAEEPTKHSVEPIVTPTAAYIQVPTIVNTETATDSSTSANLQTEPVAPTSLSFNDKDKIVNFDKKENTATIQSNTAKTIIAPKTLKRLEAISAQRHRERKNEDDDDEEEEGKIKILDQSLNMNLGELDVHVLDDKVTLKKELLKDVVELP